MIKKNLNIPFGWDFLKSILRMNHEWKLKNPKQKWCYMYGFLKTSYETIRWPVYGDNMTKVHWFGYCPHIYITIFCVLVLYTFYYNLSRGDFLSCLPCTCLAGIVLATCPIVYNAMSRIRFKIISLSIFGGQNIYHDNDFEDEEYNRICSNQLDATMKEYGIRMMMINLSLAASQIGPIFMYISYGIKTTTTNVRIPFTEPKSDVEFIVNLILQSFIGLHGGIAYLGIEAWMSLIQNIVNISPALFKLGMKRLCEQYKSKSISELQLRSNFRNLVQQSTDADDFVTEASNILYYRTLLTPIIFTYSIGIGIFCQYNMGFAAGYGMAFMSWVQLFYVCELGDNIQDNGFVEVLYSSEWEVLPEDIQKVIMHLINRKQNVAGIKLGPFGTGINRDVFKVCTNKVYTLVMFLKRFLN